MKKLLYLLLLTPIIYLASCSSGKGDLTPEPGPIEETIVGVTWQLLNVGGGWFRLNDDYTYSTKFLLCDTFAVEGVWSLDGDVIENRYIIGAVEYVERSTIIEYSDSLLKFQADTTPTADAYVWFEACEPEPIRGCMDSTFLNFNPNAQCPDTCMNDPVYGCMDANALNYNANANIDDGSCCFIEGCMDATALNYDPNACQDDGSCCFVAGCIDATAFNYDPNACYDDGSCCYVGGCMDATASNYDPNACYDDGSCITLNIGDFYEGGVVFYLDGNGGLVCDIQDISYNTLTSYKWSTNGTVVINGAIGTAIGSGQQNTIDILTVSPNFGRAAYECSMLTSQGYSDWYLPSIGELEEMYLNKVNIDATAVASGGTTFNYSGGITWSTYWSSTQYSVGHTRAFTFDFTGSGGQGTEWKEHPRYLRAVRTFSY